MGFSDMGEFENQMRYYVGIIGISGIVAMIEASIVYSQCDTATDGWTLNATDVASDNCRYDQGWYIYCLFVGIIPAFFATLMGIMHLCNPESVSQLMHQVAAFLFWIWCGIGALITTFYAPFFNPSNGYFAVWAASIASTLYLAVTFQEARIDVGVDIEVPSHKIMALLFNFSACIVVVVAILVYENTPSVQWAWNGWTIWAIVCSAGGILFTGVMLPLLRFWEDMPEGISKWFSLFYFVWWAIGTATMTYKLPFSGSAVAGQPSLAGNGYFAAWFAFISAFWFVSVQEINVQEEVENMRSV